MKNIRLLISFFFFSSFLSCADVALPSAPSGASMATQATDSSYMSVHEMFKDVPQDELLAMMAEGQEFIRYLETHGTEEEKMAFAQAMEETLQTFTDADWMEFEAIVNTVQDKLPPLFEEPVTVPTPSTITKEVVQESKVAPVVDNSIEKMLHAIYKAINAILLKAKSDKILAERMTVSWENKDDFNEMVRLIQVLNKKELYNKLMAKESKSDKAESKEDEDNKNLLEALQNFNKRLQNENDQFVIEDTFGLVADQETTAENLKKLNVILDFFDRAIASLLPKLVKFMQAYEPEALKSAQERDEQAKKALEHASKVEKQKRPVGQITQYDKYPSNGSQGSSKGSQPRMQGANYPTGAGSSEYQDSYVQSAHKEHLSNLPQQKKDGGQQGSADTNKANQDKKDNKKSAYDTAVDAAESYFDMYGNQDVGNYMKAVGKAQNMYKPFGKSISQENITKAQELQAKRSASEKLSSKDLDFLSKHEEVYQKAFDDFAKHTQNALSHYAELQDEIEKILPQIDELQQVLQIIRRSLDQMNSVELDQLYNSTLLKNLNARIKNYHDQFKSVQRELKNKHQLHILEDIDPRTRHDYEQLEKKIHSLHGLDRKISEIDSQFESLQKAIKAAIGRRKRDENKAAAVAVPAN